VVILLVLTTIGATGVMVTFVAMDVTIRGMPLSGAWTGAKNSFKPTA
jgi:hypothetical protein